MDIIGTIRDEIEAPLKQPMDLLHLGLLIGLIMVIAVLWHRVLVHLHVEG